jgi:hypothetical protein
MKRILLLALLAPAAVPSAALAKPPVCRAKTIKAALRAAGDPVDAGLGTVRCGDVTHDGARDAVFTVLSGGTAGATHFGVLTGASTTAGDRKLVLYEDGYKVGVARVNSRRFDVEQPVYRKHDANCCPSAFDVTPYRWDGSKFNAGQAARHKHAGKRFYD